MKKKIPLSKKKIALLFLGCILFIVISIWILITHPKRGIFMLTPEMVKIVAIIAIPFFGLAGFFIGKKLFSNQDGFVITEEGFIDNANAFNLGMIYWKDVTNIQTEQLYANKFILVFVNNPENYMQKVTGLKANLLKGNFRTYGTPITVSATTLQISFTALHTALLQTWEANR